jgi:hypothetical protein
VAVIQRLRRDPRIPRRAKIAIPLAGFHPDWVMTVPWLACVIGWLGASCVAWRGRRGVLAMAGEPIDRTRLPIRRPPFHGAVNRTLAGSQPDWGQIGHIRPPEGAPNVLLVLIDDAGFGNPSTFGGPVDTPNYTRMADQGLRYNRFHVTALCSPTRAALLTGRNHHTVGFGSIGELSSGFPGYTAFVPKDCAPFPKILRENGYSTAAIGKWHMTPDGQQARPGRSTAGPPAGASTTSGGSWAAKPASGTR